MDWRLDVDSLSAGYPCKVLLHDVAFSVGPGECVLLCGANGTGKSTLLRTLAGLQKPLSGTVSMSGADGAKVVLVPSKVPKVSGFGVERFIGLSSFRDTDWLGRIGPELHGRIVSAMEALGIVNLAGRDVSTLSDGEFQKVCIAAALARNAEVVLLDEPTSFLDVDAREDVLSALESLVSAPGLAGKAAPSVIFSSHDIHSAERHCTRAFGLFRDGGAVSFTDSGASASASALDSLFRRCFRHI